MKEEFTIPYPTHAGGRQEWARRYGMNAYYAGKSWPERKRDAEYWHYLTLSCMNAQQVRRRPFENPVTITFFWNDRLDLDNHAVIGKMITDALKGRVIKDDARKYLQGVCHYWHDADYIKIEVKEV